VGAGEVRPGPVGRRLPGVALPHRRARRLAELDQLRNVEVLSCVSVGSIIGAYYYLEVRHLLQIVPDHLIERCHYVKIVDRIARRFLAGVQSNIRNRAYNEIRTNFWALWPLPVWPNDARTRRLGELFESEHFDRIDDDKTRDLARLKIHPFGGDPDFDPRIHNWRRRTRVPALVLNATTLNTGHIWQFTSYYYRSQGFASESRHTAAAPAS
jgi:hypothetical protein